MTIIRATAVAGACLIAVCTAAGATADAATPGSSDGSGLTAEGDLAGPTAGSGAVTYDPQLAPVGAHVAAAIDDDGNGGTRVTLDVRGLAPDRGYAAHAHVKPCGPTAADAGPHFQNKPDPAATPAKPSSDPAFANPQNEVWLSLHTDADGDAHAQADVPFTFEENRSPRSIVIHEDATTATAAGHAGMAGTRAACITLPTS